MPSGRASKTASKIPHHLLLVSGDFFLSNSAVSEWAVVVLLGLIEGITEFLPISSTGHMLLAEHWLQPRQSDLFLTVIQSGAVPAVLIIFTARIKQLLFHWRDKESRSYFLKLAGAFIITCLGGLVLKKLQVKLPEEPAPVAWATLIGGVLFLAVERWLRRRTTTPDLSWPMALAIGAAQLLAFVFPGLSRSGSTILTALILGLARPAAIEFSFLLGIPTLLAAGVLEAFSALNESPPQSVDWGLLLLGSATAAVTAFIAVRWLLRFVQSHTFEGFGWYRIVLGILILSMID